MCDKVEAQPNWQSRVNPGKQAYEKALAVERKTR